MKTTRRVPAWCLPKRRIRLGVTGWQFLTAAQLRYPEVGDWSNQSRTITVLRTGDRVEEMALALHELVEAWLCLVRGVADWQVDRLDAAQPGGYRNRTYRNAHQYACRVERRLIEAAGRSWPAYCRKLDRLWEAEQGRGLAP